MAAGTPTNGLPITVQPIGGIHEPSLPKTDRVIDRRCASSLTEEGLYDHLALKLAKD